MRGASVAPLVYAIIPAGGSGSRMGSDIPKVLLSLEGKSVLAHTLERISRAVVLSGCVVLAPASHLEAFRSIAEPFGAVVFAGGETRSESVRRGLFALEAKFGDSLHGALVLVHDGARCLVPEGVVARAVEEAARARAVTVAVPSVDTLITCDGEGNVATPLDRSQVRAVQTPQVFSYELLRDAHGESQGEATDDATLVARKHPVRVVEGSRLNLKITVPDDLVLASSILNRK